MLPAGISSGIREGCPGIIIFMVEFREYRQAWDAALAGLREDGWEAELTCSGAPVQVEGVLPCGERFYFRARHDEVLLAVGGDDPADIAPPWERQVDYGRPGGHDASSLEAQPGLRILRELASQHQACCEHPQAAG